ncbi:MAG TPA: hypothetical protein PKH07_20220, partial [bacterium]|nr:hypothetical protein [bacterium]
SSPVQCRFEVHLGSDGSVAQNAWNLWLFPKSDRATMAKSLTVWNYSGAESSETLHGIDCTTLKWDDVKQQWIALDREREIVVNDWSNAVVATDRLDTNITATLQDGARVLYIPYQDSPMDIPRQDAPFWREMTIWLPTGHPALGDFPHESFTDLQFLDMTQRRPFALGKSRDSVNSLIWGTNARNPGANLYDYVYETSVGKGKMIACCLNLRGIDNVAGHHLLRCLAEYLISL